MSSNEPTIPSPEEALLARQVSRALEAHHAEHALRVLVAGDGDDMPPLELPPVAAELLIEILKQTADGNAVTLTPVKPQITRRWLLNVSRPFVIGLIEKGRLPVRMAGNHRRLPLSNVLAYKAATKAKAYAALQEIG